MSGHRVLVSPGSLIDGATVTLDDEEGNHLRVRRAGAGEQVELFDGAGTTATGTLERPGKGWSVVVSGVQHHAREPMLILAVGAGDRDRFLSLAEKCTELGVTRLVPLSTERASQVETRLRESGVERARKRVREACKQSGNPWATEVDDLTRLEALGALFPDAKWLLADPQGDIIPTDLSARTSIGWLIGPEGGFSEAEVMTMRSQLGATSVRLTRHVMRFETAAVVAAGIARSGVAQEQ